MIINHIFFDKLDKTILDPDTTFFAFAPILIDTKWFNPDLYKKKWTDLDKKYFDLLHKIYPVEKSYYEELWRLKTDE